MDLYSYAYFFFFFCTRTSLSFSLFTQFSLSVGCHGLNIRPTRLGRWLIVPSPNLSSMAAVNSSQVFWALFRCSLAWSLLLDWSVCVCSRERIGDQREAFLHLHPLHVSSHLIFLPDYHSPSSLLISPLRDTCDVLFACSELKLHHRRYFL